MCVVTPVAVESFDARVKVTTEKSHLTLLSKGAYEAGHVMNDIVAADTVPGESGNRILVEV